MKSLVLFIRGQVRGGKNNYIVLRNGMHVPRKEWAKWRDLTVAQLLSQRLGVIFDKPCSIEVRYFKGDLRRRDVPGMADALCHCLERSGIVSDDALLINWTWVDMGISRDNPRADIRMEEIEP